MSEWAVATEVPVSLIDLSPTNPRSDLGDIDSLASSVASIGLVNPLLVRSVGERFELVSGHRRLAAVQKLNWPHVPCRVVLLTDDEAREAQIAENLQRENVKPSEEAAAVRQLVSRIGAGSAAAKLGKPIGYVRRCVHLEGLIPEMVERLDAGNLPMGHALLLAGHSEETQRRVMGRMFQANLLSGQALLPVRLDHLKGILEIEGADRNLAGLSDDFLVGVSPSCAGCPKRMVGDLFGEQGDRCQDTACFKGKAHRYAALRAHGRLLLVSGPGVDESQFEHVGHWLPQAKWRGAGASCPAPYPGVVFNMTLSDLIADGQACLDGSGCPDHWPAEKTNDERKEPKKRGRKTNIERALSDKKRQKAFDEVEGLALVLGESHIDWLMIAERMWRSMATSEAKAVAEILGVQVDQVSRLIQSSTHLAKSVIVGAVAGEQIAGWATAGSGKLKRWAERRASEEEKKEGE